MNPGDPRYRDVEGIKGLNRLSTHRKIMGALTEEQMNEDKNRHIMSPLQKEVGKDQARLIIWQE